MNICHEKRVYDPQKAPKNILYPAHILIPPLGRTVNLTKFWRSKITNKISQKHFKFNSTVPPNQLPPPNQLAPPHQPSPPYQLTQPHQPQTQMFQPPNLWQTQRCNKNHCRTNPNHSQKNIRHSQNLIMLNSRIKLFGTQHDWIML